MNTNTENAGGRLGEEIGSEVGGTLGSAIGTHFGGNLGGEIGSEVGSKLGGALGEDIGNDFVMNKSNEVFLRKCLKKDLSSMMSDFVMGYYPNSLCISDKKEINLLNNWFYSDF